MSSLSDESKMVEHNGFRFQIIFPGLKVISEMEQGDFEIQKQMRRDMFYCAEMLKSALEHYDKYLEKKVSL